MNRFRVIMLAALVLGGRVYYPAANGFIVLQVKPKPEPPPGK